MSNSVMKLVPGSSLFCLIKCLNKNIISIPLRRNFTSFLFVPRGKSNNVKKPQSSLQPQLDHLFQPGQTSIIETSIKARQMNKIDFDSVSLRLQKLRALKHDLENIEKLRRNQTDIINNQKLKSGSTPEMIEENIAEARKLRIEYNTTQGSISELEKDLVPTILSLPNILQSPDVPLTDYRVLQVSRVPLSKFDHSPKNHVEICTALNCLKFPNTNPGAHYLTGQLASLELATLDYFADKYLEREYERFSNPDIFKSVVVEGSSGADVNDPRKFFQLEDEESDEGIVNHATTHRLIGSASLSAFCAYFTKQCVQDCNFPLKMFATGRNYRPADTEHSPSLFNCQQGSQLSFFIPYVENRSVVYEQALDILRTSFDELEVHYRVVEIGACKLSPAESRRTEIEMWSPSTQSYHTVSTISDYGDFISKRLWMCFKDKNKRHEFINIVSGTSIAFPPFLACLVENGQMQNGHFKIPNTLQPYITRFY